MILYDLHVSFSICIVDQMFWEVMQLRKEMSLAKLGYFKEEL